MTEYLPSLFLSEEEKKELDDLVVLQPHWLISVMKVIIELNPTKTLPGVSLDKVSKLERDGVADIKLLQECWKEFVSTTSGSPDPDTQIHRLCLILQAYCLIYPLQSAVPAAVNGSHSPASPQLQKFIVPCKLPAQLSHRVKFKPVYFYFDFYQFLPDEIYHRLICLAMAKAKPSRGCRHQFSATQCVFYGLEGTNWVMELETEKQRLKIGVM